MDIEKLIKRLKCPKIQSCPMNREDISCKACQKSIRQEVITALSTLHDENEKLRAEFERVKRLYESEKEDFIDFACSGVPNLSPYCLNRHQDCVDERGWCRAEKCRGFSRERNSQKED